MEKERSSQPLVVLDTQAEQSHFTHVSETILNVLVQAKLILDYICMSDPR